MKKNTLLYVILVFLVVMNGFFMVKIFGEKGPYKSNPGNFIAKELQFDADQLKAFQEINQEHHEEMRAISKEIKKLKDELFSLISEADVDEATVKNIAQQIGEKEQQKDIKTFYHFREVEKICTPSQKERFNTILKDALHKHARKRPK